MSAIRKIQFDAIFEDTELCTFLEINNVCIKGLKNIYNLSSNSFLAVKEAELNVRNKNLK